MLGAPPDARETSTPARTWIALLLTVGVAWRLVRYGLAFPLWGDEAGLMLEVLERPRYADLLQPLDRGQVAPVGFLALQLTAVQHWGTSEYAVRLFPLLTGLAALFLFARLARLALPPLGAMAAVGLLTSTHYVTRYSLDVKPYGTDLMVSAMLLVLALEWDRAPARRRWPILLIVATPVALVLSYPAVFVAGAIVIGLLPVLRRRRAGRGPWALWATYAATVVVSFAAVLAVSAGPQYERTGRELVAWWVRGFPPAAPLQFVQWLLDVHTAEMLSYPVGGKNGASTLTLILCLVGVRQLVKRRHTDLLLLLGSIFALTFAAAALRRYPYGGSARVAQHLAPAICLFAGAAIASIADALETAPRRRIAGLAAGGAFLALALGGLVRDVWHPHHTRVHREVAVLAAAWARERADDSRVWLMSPLESLPFVVQWYGLRAVGGDRARLDGGGAAPSALSGPREWWVLNCDARREGNPRLTPRAELAAAGYVLRRSRRLVLSESSPGVADDILELERWERGP